LLLADDVDVVAAMPAEHSQSSACGKLTAHQDRHRESIFFFDLNLTLHDIVTSQNYQSIESLKI
jgi:hypothetical protein